MLKEKRFLYNFEPKATHKRRNNMKKEYMKPSMEVIEIKNGCQILAGSVANASGNVFEGEVTGGSGQGRAPEFQEMQDLLFGE